MTDFKPIDPQGESGNPDSTPEAIELSRTLEGLLFVADRALTLTDLATVTGSTEQEVSAAIHLLQAHYQNRGIIVLYHNDSYRLVSAPDLAQYCRHLLGLDERTRLSRAALETLGIVAYRQGTTRTEIERIRGVDSDSALATLLSRNLIRETGRLEGPGRPAVFATTDTFLTYFGITSLSELPEMNLEELTSEVTSENLPEPDLP